MKTTALAGLVLLGLIRFTHAGPVDDNAAVSKQIRASLTAMDAKPQPRQLDGGVATVGP